MTGEKRRELMTLLQRNGRLLPSEISAMLGETPEAIIAAIAELERQGAIIGYTALVDWDKIGDERITAMIDVKIPPQRDVGFDRLAQRIARFPEVKNCYLMSGTYDLSIILEAASLKEVARFVSERLSTIEGVASTTTHFVLKRYKHEGVQLWEDGEDDRLAVAP